MDYLHLLFGIAAVLAIGMNIWLTYKYEELEQKLANSKVEHDETLSMLRLGEKRNNALGDEISAAREMQGETEIAVRRLADEVDHLLEMYT